MWLGQGLVLQGWALAEQGQIEEEITHIRQGLTTYQALGADMFQPYFLVLLAEAYGIAGQTEDGLATLAEALVVVDKSGERFYEAELYRLRGELTLAQSSVQGPASEVTNSLGTKIRSSKSEAEECFLKALDIARKQQAKSLELHAVMSLARLW